MAFKYGRLAPAPLPVKDFSHYLLAPLPQVPDELDAPDVSSYPMAGNDKLGDCTIASVVHCNQVWSSDTHEPYQYPGDAAVEKTYFSLTGGADTGCVEANVLKTWQTTGLFGNKIRAYAPASPKHMPTVKAVTFLYGAAYTGVLVPAPAQSQFAQGEPWDLTGTDGDYQIEGGHAVPIVGYDENYLTVVTWGKLQKVTYRWWMTYAEECWAIISEQFAEDPHIDIEALESDLSVL